MTSKHSPGAVFSSMSADHAGAFREQMTGMGVIMEGHLAAGAAPAASLTRITVPGGDRAARLGRAGGSVDWPLHARCAKSLEDLEGLAGDSDAGEARCSDP